MEISRTAAGAAEAVENRLREAALVELRDGRSDRIREPVNWGLLVALLGCLAFWGLVALGLLVAF